MGAGASVQTLSAQDIGDFVASLGSAYEPYRATIIDNGFSGEVLADITQESELNEMLDGMGITNVVHRKALYKKFTSIGLMSPRLTLTLPNNLGTPKSGGQTPVASSQISDHLTKSPRQILSEMFKIQGIRLDPQDIHDACGKIKSASRRSLSSTMHGDYEYDCFISYRVSSDVDIAEKLYLYLKAEGITAFFDKRCLKDGENWKTGFINGLLKSRCFISLISTGALAPCRNIGINHDSDNYLIEMEAALSVKQLTENNQFIVPVFIGESNGNVLKKFHDFSPDLYADSLHAQKVVATRAPAATNQQAAKPAGVTATNSVPSSSGAGPAASSAAPSRFFSGPATPLQPTTVLTTKKYVSGTYTGEIKSDQRHGRGRMDLDNGDHFDGQWMNDRRSGFGKLVRANGEVYEGHWEGDQLNGSGSIRYSSGDVYEGELQNTRANGRGTFIYADGKRYDGQWRDSRKQGVGTMIFPSGHSYTGDWVDDAFHGQGKYAYASGNVYEGQYVRGQMEGIGTIRYTSGNYYTGHFHAGKKHGQGKQCVNGVMEEGTWVNDVKQ